MDLKLKKVYKEHLRKVPLKTYLYQYKNETNEE